MTNFGAVSIVERVVWDKSDGNIKDAHGQASHTQIGIKFLAHLSDEKIAFLCEVFSKPCSTTIILEIVSHGATRNKDTLIEMNWAFDPSHSHEKVFGGDDTDCPKEMDFTKN